MLKRLAIIPALLIAIVLCASIPGQAQRRDYFTEEEIELVRENQDIDKRIGVLTRMLDRRFKALGIEVAGWQPTEKEKSIWGEARTGTRTQLFLDVRDILQKAIDDIDDVAAHNENTLTQNKTGGLLFPKAVRDLAAASARYLPSLKAAAAGTKDDLEKAPILASIESCEAILDSVSKLPPEPTKEEKKKGKGR
jgi:hypothetical protein